jgi:P-loop Domain of unknown function (DUF2791)
VLHLSSLSQEDFLVLLGKILNVFAYGEESRQLLPEEAILAFMNHCHQRIGEAYFRTPRTTITAFVNLLSVLEQNPGLDWRDLLGRVEITRDMGGSADLPSDETPAADSGETPVSNIAANTADDEFTSFRL